MTLSPYDDKENTRRKAAVVTGPQQQ